MKTLLEESRTAGTLPYEIDCALRMSYFGTVWVLALDDGAYRAEYAGNSPAVLHVVCIYRKGSEIYHH